MHPADTRADSATSTTADTTESPQVPSTRSPQLVRLAILLTFGIGFLGLSLSGGQGALPTVAVTNASAHTIISPEILRSGDLSVRHASRSRVVAPKPAAKPVARPAAPKRSVKKAASRRAVSSGRTWVRPMGGGVDSGYGPRWGRMHKGIDFSAPSGTAIRSIGAGTVIGAGYLGSESGYGKITIIRHAGGVYSAYAHQSRTAVSAGERVKAGEIIGYVGSTGHSTGPHLHFEIRMSPHGGQVNPVRWLRAHGVRI